MTAPQPGLLSAEELAERLREACECADCVDAERTEHGWTGTAGKCLYCQATAQLAKIEAERDALKQQLSGIPKSDQVRLARPSAPDGDVTNVGTQSVAQLIADLNSYAAFDERLKQLTRQAAAQLAAAKADAERLREALRWIYEHGLRVSELRPSHVNEALNNAYDGHQPTDKAALATGQGEG